jgi:5'-methylthioadenosine phosphorylase
MAFVTDYDCWHEEEEDVTTDAVVAVLKDNASLARDIVKKVILSWENRKNTCACRDALGSSILTPLDKIPEAVRSNLSALLKKYL